MTTTFPSGSAVTAYLRDSGGDEQDLSVAQQLAVVQKWCADNHLHLSQVFTDLATPGSSTIGRRAFQEMIHFFHQDGVQERGVILWKFSRFSRDQDDSQYYRADLRRRGFIVHSLNDNIPDNTNGRVIETLIDWMNAKFLEDLSLDVKRGLHHNLNKFGTLPGVPPRGFKREQVTIGTRRDGSPHLACKWVPDPDWWDKCSEAWELRARGVPIKEIHRQTRLFSSRTSYVTFFRNRLYTGVLKFGDTIIPDYAPPLVSEETWNAVQHLNHENQEENNPFDNPQHPKRSNSSFVLSGIMVCAHCGSIMNGNMKVTSSGYRLEYYYCSRAHRNMDCNARPIPKTTIEEMVIQCLKEFILDPKTIAERDRELSIARSGSVSEAHKVQVQLTRKTRDIQDRINNILDKLETTRDAPQSLVDRLHELEDQKQEYHLQLERMRSIENHETVFARTVQEAQILADRVKDLFDTENINEKRAVLQYCIQNVIAERDGQYARCYITFWNPDNNLLSDNSPGENDEGTGAPARRGQIMATRRRSVEAQLHRHTFVLYSETQIPRLYTKKT